MHGVSNRDTHLFPQHNISSVPLRSPMECVVGEQRYKAPHFHPRHRHPPPRNDHSKKSLWVRPNRLRTGVGCFRSCLYKWDIASSATWVWRRRTNCRQCCSLMSNPPTSPWIAWPDGSGRWDNRMAAEHLPRDLVRPSSGSNNWRKRRILVILL